MPVWPAEDEFKYTNAFMTRRRVYGSQQIRQGINLQTQLACARVRSSAYT